MKKIVLLSLTIIVFYAMKAQIKLPGIFTDHMVLQRNVPINIWGTAAAGEQITVQFNKQQKAAKADAQGNWKAILAIEKAGGPYELTVVGKNTITIKDVLVGEVWVCSGQSNMEWILADAKNAATEIAAANYPQIRHIKIARAVDVIPQNDIVSGSQWQVCTPQQASSFSAVGYFFARKISQELQVPVGLVNTSWVGTNVETWISKNGFAGNEDFKKIIEAYPTGMPALIEQHKKRMEAVVNIFEGGETNNDTNTALWMKPEYDDSKWKAISPLQLWEEQGLPNFDGNVWYRKTVELTETQAASTTSLQAGMIDDSDSTYVNGIFVGATINKWNAKRKYTLPQGILKKGKNVIAIKVMDNGGGGGLYGDAADFSLQVNGSNFSIADSWKVKVDKTSIQFSVQPNSLPSLLYNAMVHPIIQYGMRGVIWYQGESNADRAHQYQTTFPALIKDWRSQFKQGDFPFYFVQLASFNANNENGFTGSQWAELREAQAKTLYLPNTGMVVTTDIGTANDIHPKNKQDVGLRLALLALKKTYSKNVFAFGPVYKNMEAKNAKVVLYFNETAKGLSIRNDDKILTGFMIAGADKQFKEATAIIKGNTIIVDNATIANPVAVRYAWVDNAAKANLSNSENLPAIPFRTDNWKGLTDDKKYKVE